MIDAALQHEIDTAEPAWHRVDSPVFVYAACVNGRTWVLRLNDFPDHPLFTLFVDAMVVGDLDDPPARWHLHPNEALPLLDPRLRRDVLTPLRHLGRYGAEAGQPCEGMWCHCDVLTEAYIMSAADVTPPPA